MGTLTGSGECWNGDCEHPEHSKLDIPKLIALAAGLKSEHGENPEYDRALVELVVDAAGASMEEKTKYAAAIGIELFGGYTKEEEALIAAGVPRSALFWRGASRNRENTNSERLHAAGEAFNHVVSALVAAVSRIRELESLVRS